MRARDNSIRTVVLAMFATALLLPARPGAAAEKKPPGPVVVRFLGDVQTKYNGKQVMVLGVEPVGGGRPYELVVPNNDANKPQYDPLTAVATVVKSLSKGDAIKVEHDYGKPRPVVKSVAVYAMKPGEDSPNTYRFDNSFSKNEGGQKFMAVVMSRLGDQVTAAVPRVKQKEGGMADDPQMLALLETLKAGDILEAEIRPGLVPVLTSLDLYRAPETAKFVKISEVDVEGGKGSAVELDQDGKAVTLTLPGKMQGKKWVADGKMLAAVKKIKKDAEVQFRTREADGKVWLKSLQPAPKSRDAGKADKGDKDEKDDMKKKKR